MNNNDSEKFYLLQKKSYKKLASCFDRKQNRANRNHFNKIEAIGNYLNIQNGDKVLEIGMGTGIHAKYIIEKYHDIKFVFYGTELSPDMLNESKHKLSYLDNVCLSIENGENLSFADNFFDKVYVSGSLHHFHNPEKGIQEMMRVLKKDGKFCIMEPNFIFPINFFGAYIYPEEKNIKLMTKNNFNKWLKKLCKIYKITNFAYTPPKPKMLIKFFDILDSLYSKIPIIRSFSIMLFITGKK
jgi:ubiquinone/menaquinone biosynthesis C-methylase UbiE